MLPSQFIRRGKRMKSYLVGKHDGCLCNYRIVIIVNPMVVFYIKQLLLQILQPNEKIIVIEFYRKKLLSEKIIGELKSTFPNSFEFLRYNYQDNYFKYIFYLAKAINKLNFFGHQHVHFYLAHPNHILTNYIYFTLSKRPLCKVNLIPDGIANFYRASTKSFIIGMVLKKILALFLLVNYRIYLCDYLGIEKRIYSQYFFLGHPNYSSEINLCQSEIKLHKFNKRLSSVNQEKIILLGQGVPKKKRIIYLDALKKVLNFIRSKYRFEIVYRPHPSESLSNELISYFYENNIRIDNSDGIAEDIISSYKICCGFFSSAQINCLLMFNAKTEQIIFDGDFMSHIMPFLDDIGRKKDLISIFTSLGGRVVVL